MHPRQSRDRIPFYMRLLGASAATAVLGLGTAGHAFASGSYDPSTTGTAASAMAVPGASLPEPPPIPGADPFVPGLVPNPGPGPVVGPSTVPRIEPPPADTTSSSESEPAPEASGEIAPTPPEITTTTDSDGGNLNVSVRIDSPGTDGPVTQENSGGSVVSPPPAPDITPPEPVAGAVAPDPAQEPTQQQPTQSGSTNTNVSVRVLSPGDNGEVSQDNSATVPPRRPDGSDTASSGSAQDAVGQPSDSPQYQGANSQYQSGDINIGTQEVDSDSSSTLEPWNWTWELSICDGNATSLSTESGSQESRDWTWNWIWNWSCDGPVPGTETPSDAPSIQDRGSGVPQSGPANINVSIRVLSPGDNGSVSQTNTSSNASDTTSTPTSSVTQATAGTDDPSWLWMWTFTWCGTTMEFPTAAGQGTGLDWVWNWLWVWDCDGGAQQPSLPTPDTGSGDTGGDTAQTAPQSAPPPSTDPLPTAQIPVSAVPTDAADGNGPAVDSLAIEPIAFDPLAVDPLAFDLPAIDLAAIAAKTLEPPTIDSDFVLPVATSVQAAMDAVFRSWPALPMAPPQIEVFVDPKAPSVPSIVVSVPSVLPPTLSISPFGTQPSIELEIPVPAFSAPTWLAGPQPVIAPDAHKPTATRTESPDAPPAAATSQVATAGWVQAPPTEPKTERSGRPAEPSAARASRSNGGSLPHRFPPLEAAGFAGSTGGGAAPSVLLIGLATLIGFFVLAAPGLGRRIRLARTPSPRGRFGSSIDRPG